MISNYIVILIAIMAHFNKKVCSHISHNHANISLSLFSLPAVNRFIHFTLLSWLAHFHCSDLNHASMMG